MGQDTKVKTPWCYTTDPEIRYDYCSQIPKCSDLQPELEAATEVTLASVCFNGKIGDYHKQSGVRASMTKSGRTCQRWDSDSPHNTRNNGPHLASNRNNNYCSDHDLAAAWCYTTDPNKRWESATSPTIAMIRQAQRAPSLTKLRFKSNSIKWLKA